jgi:hypothetical protein
MAEKTKDLMEPIRETAEASIREKVVQKLTAETSRGSQTASSLPDFLNQLKSEIPTETQEMSLEEKIRGKMALRYIENLRARYTWWEPISRWSGAEPN